MTANNRSPTKLCGELVQRLRQLDSRSPDYAALFLQELLRTARRWNASDVHLQPTPEGLELAVRLDGVIHPLAVFPPGDQTDIVTRLKVLASLLTYRTDLPQEGRVKEPAAPAGESSETLVEMRASTFPTLYGERAVIRIFAGQKRLTLVDDLGLPADLKAWLMSVLQQTSGMLLITGPAGSGKTTTLYACLREILAVSQRRRSILTMEDPIETALPGAAQSQVNEAAGLTLAAGIRSLVRQDPEVLMIGEIRDPDSANAAMNASLAGNLVLSSFHAGDIQRAVARLSDMGVEPYMIQNGLLGVVNQRLARRLCECAVPSAASLENQLDPTAEEGRTPVGCDECLGTGYRGRLLLTAWQDLKVGAASMNSDSPTESPPQGLDSLWANGIEAVRQGATSMAELRRVLGLQ